MKIAALIVTGAAWLGVAAADRNVPGTTGQTWTGPAAVREYQRGKSRLLRTADLMPAEHYGFRLNSNSKAFAANLVAVAGLGARTCGEWTGKTVDLGAGDLQTTITTKADVASALGKAFAACDQYFSPSSGRPPIPSAALDSLLDHFTSMANFLAGHLRAKGIEPPR
jgi:hypothetical protein